MKNAPKPRRKGRRPKRLEQWRTWTNFRDEQSRSPANTTRNVAGCSSLWAFLSLWCGRDQTSVFSPTNSNTQAPSEAEAQCAELARGGKVRALNNFHTSVHRIVQVYAAGSEDMDTLTFSAPVLFRHLTFSEAKKQPISEINLKAALEGLDMTMSQVC
jgi:hypothetical protein